MAPEALPEDVEPDAESTPRDTVVAFLRSQYEGPSRGPHEEIRDRPDRLYLVGTLYPQGDAAPSLDGDTLGEDVNDEALDDSVDLANAWHPASAGVSFLHDGDLLFCSVSAAYYTRSGSDQPWTRHPLLDEDVPVERSESGVSSLPVLEGRARLFAVWRRVPAGWLMTVAVENTRSNPDPSSPPATEDCLFQTHLTCRVEDGTVLPYPDSSDLSDDPEDEELRLLYSHRRVYGAGHGCSVDWSIDPDGAVRTVGTEMMPATVVSGVKTGSEHRDIRVMRHLEDPDTPTADLRERLLAFVSSYETWVAERRREADQPYFPIQHHPAAGRLIERLDRAAARMRAGVELLTGEGPESTQCLRAFRLANKAMRLQFLQSQLAKAQPGVRGRPLPKPNTPSADQEPAWKPFQLAFLLLSIPSTFDPRHADRELVDLIWFPTGGGKTEAYLGLAAFEMLRRRLQRGVHGGGTAVITRYTLRLLTTQQLQRAAALVCALEQLRDSEPDLAQAPAFTIGLWVGGETTPNDFATAADAAQKLRVAQYPEGFFQIQVCPWCATPLYPERRLPDDDAYGIRATKHSFDVFCPHPACPFHERLPVRVVDDQIFADPPTMVVATVDKFARLPWVAKAGSILGRGNVPYDPPGLVIQDELHLLSGPLGTTVALYESAIQSVLEWDGTPPKIVASTATIRASGHQVRNLYGRSVALFPPSGLSADDSHYAVLDEDSPGRLYVGIMPQAHTQAFATVLTCAALLQAPETVTLQGRARDAYWTLVAYHNSLRELGRTVTIARDDVETLLQARDTDGQGRHIKREGVIELTSNVRANRLVSFLSRLELSVEDPDAVDLVATTNMLSVGIDISRLGLMLMNGQPKTTSEYIQATSRVGRADVPGLVITLLRATKPRDRSHYEGFRGYHEAIYRHVEPTSVTPWSLASRQRSLPAALALLVRHGCGLRENTEAGQFHADDADVKHALDSLLRIASSADPDEAAETRDELRRLAAEWQSRAEQAAAAGVPLRYHSTTNDPALLRDFGQAREGWDAMHSMRAVDRQTRVLAIGEQL
jgi:hypothetical protein